MSKRVAILQSSYIPWKGYFDIIHDVDELIFLDEAQYTKRDWRTRNRIKTSHGPAWLSIPVGGHRDRRICDVELPGSWADAHWRRIAGCYARAPYFETYRAGLEEIFLHRTWQYLSELNQHLIRTIAHDALGIRTHFRDSRELVRRGRGEEWILDLLDQVGAETYVSGPSARAYIDAGHFAARGIKLIWKSYDGYPEYPQFHPPFVHEVTILDLLFHTGPDAAQYIWGWRSNAR
jgi:hypothetical protein